MSASGGPGGQMSGGVSRRSFLRAAGYGAAGLAGAGVLAACGTASPSAAAKSASGSYGTVSVQLSWIKNIEFAGEFYAEHKGYYREAGFSAVNLLAGGSASTSPESLVLTGKVLTGMSTPVVTAAAIVNENAPLKIIGSTYQKNPFCILSLEQKTPITTIADLKGKKIGVQTGPNETIWNGFLKVNHIDPAELTKVPVQYDPTVLATGTVDGYLAYVTNEPILMKEKGFTPVLLEFAEHGLAFTTETLVVAEQAIQSQAAVLKAFLTAEIRGWNQAVASPAGSARLAADVYGKDQNLSVTEQTQEAIAQNGLVVSADTKKNGLFTMTDALIQENITALAAMGTTITASRLFDMSLLHQVYAENPGLITG